MDWKGSCGSLSALGVEMEKAIFAAGCFWGVEDAFMALPGVISTRVGYTGGHTDKPSYKDVCTGDTGHAEAVEIMFEPDKISYEQLLDVFWKSHDPTQLNRQGPDFGTQYRSAIFYVTEMQRQQAEASLKNLEQSGCLGRAVVTEVTAASEFWAAEEYHQKYHQKHGGGCRF
jgi:peptide-methionine (S)-S-oxide reductase